MKHICDNCGKKWDIKDVVWIWATDLHQRVEPGGIVPSGECRDCGALCYPEPSKKSKSKVYITMEGGLIRVISVTKDLKDVEFIVVDFDVEGAESEDLSLCNNEEAYVRKQKADEIVKRGQFKIKMSWEESI